MVAICTGLALRGGSDALTIVTVRTLGVLAILALYLRAAGVAVAGPKFTAHDRAVALAIGIPMAANNYTMSASLQYIPIPLAILIFYTWPALITIASWFLGKERFSGRALVATIAALAGLGLALGVDFSAAERTGVALALFSAFAWAFTALSVGHFFKGRDARPVTFWMTVTGASVFVTAVLVTREVALPHSAGGWIGLSGVAFFFAFGMIGLFTATAAIGAARAGFFMNFEPVTTLAVSSVLFGQALAPMQLAGAALVIVALFVFRPPVRKG